MKRDKIIYWLVTGILAIGFVLSSFMYLSKNPDMLAQFKRMGYPEYFVTILGVAKLMAAIAIINPWLPKLKEWAYAGYAIVLIGAVWTHIATQTPFVAPLVFLLLAGVSYFFYNRLNAVNGKGR